MAAKFTSAPGTEGGSKMPTISCPCQCLRKRRASTIAPTSEAKYFTLGLCPSAMANRNGCRRAV